ncbi:MAG TPA: hypothetical protein PLK54_02390 [Ferruginibacter sp.]|jgi:hypothetical protein|nr:hypothetical protein [Ferruginibacter sp.]MBN8700079.1 hypothetical protein [Chitinophagales bacterium]HMU72540.1 hypothetical protein [Ferruginibacter sp.]HMW25696.1 hypothetical protein [Ferruginibacter sp.]HMX37297.1 hypothetical protein [Ferruginibacter sp.]
MYTEAQQRTLVEECHKWIDELVAYREKINKLKSELYYFAPGKTDHDVLLNIEHFHNQFHIQLINIHDLKHEIRSHLKEAERHPTFGHRIPHHYVHEKLETLENDINKLEEEFHAFVQK